MYLIIQQLSDRMGLIPDPATVALVLRRQGIASQSAPSLEWMLSRVGHILNSCSDCSEGNGKPPSITFAKTLFQHHWRARHRAVLRMNVQPTTTTNVPRPFSLPPNPSHFHFASPTRHLLVMSSLTSPTSLRLLQPLQLLQFILDEVSLALQTQSRQNKLFCCAANRPVM